MKTYALDNSLSVDRFFNLQLESWLSSFNRQAQSFKNVAQRLRLATTSARRFDKVCLRLRTNELVSSNAALDVSRKLFCLWKNIFHSEITLLLGCFSKIIMPVILGMFRYVLVYFYLFSSASIPVTNTSVNPARSLGVAIYAGDWAITQLWLFWLAPIAGALLGALIYRFIGSTED